MFVDFLRKLLIYLQIILIYLHGIKITLLLALLGTIFGLVIGLVLGEGFKRHGTLRDSMESYKKKYYIGLWGCMCGSLEERR